jgi:RNA polymerase sigma-70 factor (ECF subfamily)
LSRSKDKSDVFLEHLQPLQGRLEGYCRRMLRKRDQVEDALQSILALAFSQFDRYAQGTNFKAWIFRIATFEIFNRNRKHEPTTREALPSDLPVDESSFLAQEDTFAAMLDDPDVVLDHFDEVVAGALARLSPHERAVLLLKSIGELSYQEIHELLAIPLGSVMGYLSRARKRLRLALAAYATEHGLYRSESSPRKAHP